MIVGVSCGSPARTDFTIYDTRSIIAAVELQIPLYAHGSIDKWTGRAEVAAGIRTCCARLSRRATAVRTRGYGCYNYAVLL